MGAEILEGKAIEAETSEEMMIETAISKEMTMAQEDGIAIQEEAARVQEQIAQKLAISEETENQKDLILLEDRFFKNYYSQKYILKVVFPNYCFLLYILRTIFPDYYFIS